MKLGSHRDSAWPSCASCHLIWTFFASSPHFTDGGENTQWQAYLREMNKSSPVKSFGDNVSHSGLPRWLSSNEPASQCRRRGLDPWVRKTPRRRYWLPTPVSLPGESHGQSILAGYSPCGLQESDTTEPLNWTELNIIKISVAYGHRSSATAEPC